MWRVDCASGRGGGGREARPVDLKASLASGEILDMPRLVISMLKGIHLGENFRKDAFQFFSSDSLSSK